MIAPFRGHDRREYVAFDRRDDIRIELGRVAGDAERAILAKAAGTPGDLSDLLRIEPAQAPAVKLA